MLVRRYLTPGDREIAGLLAALFAYGRVEAICRTVGSILDDLGPSPRASLLEGRHREASFAPGFRYRFQNRADLVALLGAVARMLEEEGDLGLALKRRQGDGRAGVEGLDRALTLLAADLWTEALRLAGDERRRAVRHLLPDPSGGSAGKRWRLYLRLMIRPDDGIDCGAWRSLFTPADLTLPLDTHWIRLGPRLGLTARKSSGPAMAREITSALRRLRPDDPLFYDLPLCHFGIDGGCPPRLDPDHCRACRLRPVCATGTSGALR